jgi:hypothetical protein
MSLDSEQARLIDAERRAESQRAAMHEQEARRQAGVAWSGLAPDPFRPRSTAALAAMANTRLAALQRWRASAPGRLLAAMIQAERAVEALRAGVARGLQTEAMSCAQALHDLESAARAARGAMDARPPSPLSDGHVQ